MTVHFGARIDGYTQLPKQVQTAITGTVEREGLGEKPWYLLDNNRADSVDAITEINQVREKQGALFVPYAPSKDVTRLETRGPQFLIETILSYLSSLQNARIGFEKIQNQEVQAPETGEKLGQLFWYQA